MKPINNKIQLDIKELKFGAVQSDSIEEHGTITALGDYVNNSKFVVGNTLYFKAWAVDVITKDDQKYYFIKTKKPICEYCGKEESYIVMEQSKVKLKVCLKCIKRALGNLL